MIAAGTVILRLKGGGAKVSVGPPYFNGTFVPLMVPMIIALGIGPLLAWKRGDLMGALGRGDTIAIARLLIMQLATLVALVAFVKSFVDARRSRS